MKVSSPRTRKGPDTRSKVPVNPTGNPGAVSTDGSSSSSFVTSGMQFMLPPTPSGMTAEMRDLILGGSFYSVLDDNEASPIEPRPLIQYLLAVGTAVPIPKATISNPLKEKLSTPGFKSHAKDGAPPIPRDVSLQFQQSRLPRSRVSPHSS